MDECINRETIVDLIYEIAFLSNIKKYKGFFYSSESFKDSDSVKIFIVREWKTVLHKQQKKA